MAIIYTYPTKTTPVGEDLVLISDSEDVSETKNATITSIIEILDVVDTLAATLPLSVDVSTGAVTMSSRAYAGGAITGYVPSGGVAGQYLDGTGSWVAPSGSGTVTGAGTANKITKWSTGGSGIEDSIITDSGTTVSIAGDFSTQGIEINKYLTDGVGSTGADGYILSSTTVSGEKEVVWIANSGGGSITGTWTPIMLGFTGTYTSFGYYVQNGRKVTAFFYIDCTVGATSSANAIISGIPVNALQLNGANGAVTIGNNTCVDKAQSYQAGQTFGPTTIIMKNFQASFASSSNPYELVNGFWPDSTGNTFTLEGVYEYYSQT